MSVKPLTHGAGSVAPPGLRARGGRGLPRAPFGRPGLRIARSYGANNGGPEGRGCLAPGAVPAPRAGTSPGSAAVPARQAPPGAPGILEGPVGRPMRFRAHSLTHAARAILMEGIAMEWVRRKTAARHECKTSYSWPRLGATAALSAAVPGAQSCGQRPGEKGARTMRFGAHSLTHGMHAIFRQDIAMKRIRRKMGRRHECKIAYSCRLLRRPSGAPRAGATWTPGSLRSPGAKNPSLLRSEHRRPGGLRLLSPGRRAGQKGRDKPGVGSRPRAPSPARGAWGPRRPGGSTHAISRALSYSWRAGDFDGRHCVGMGYAKNAPAP